MTKLLLTSLLFFSIISSDVVLGILHFDDCTISISESPAENETEKENSEESKEESKINIEALNGNGTDDLLLGKLYLPFQFQLSDPYLEHFSPPPEQL